MAVADFAGAIIGSQGGFLREGNVTLFIVIDNTRLDEVLSLIRISAEFYLGLTWKAPKAWGMARLTVEVEIAFFSTSVSLEVERQFAGGSADPPFSALVAPDDWETYLTAFA